MAKYFFIDFLFEKPYNHVYESMKLFIFYSGDVILLAFFTHNCLIHLQIAFCKLWHKNHTSN